jgi:hypothetical protein
LRLFQTWGYPLRDFGTEKDVERGRSVVGDGRSKVVVEVVEVVEGVEGVEVVETVLKL